MQCSSCATENAEPARFCKACGTRLVAVENPAGAASSPTLPSASMMAASGAASSQPAGWGGAGAPPNPNWNTPSGGWPASAPAGYPPASGAAPNWNATPPNGWAAPSGAAPNGWSASAGAPPNGWTAPAGAPPNGWNAPSGAQLPWGAPAAGAWGQQAAAGWRGPAGAPIDWRAVAYGGVAYVVVGYIQSLMLIKSAIQTMNQTGVEPSVIPGMLMMFCLAACAAAITIQYSPTRSKLEAVIAVALGQLAVTMIVCSVPCVPIQTMMGVRQVALPFNFGPFLMDMVICVIAAVAGAHCHTEYLRKRGR